MARFASSSAVFALLLAASAAASARDSEWWSYRDAYRSMVQFEKYGRAKNFLQQHLQVMPKEKGASTDGLRLTLATAAAQRNLPLDAAGRAVFPLLKAAYDDNAVLQLNRPAGQYALRVRVTVAVRADAVYEAADLRAACAQALDVLQYGGAARGLRCVGLRFVFAPGSAGAMLKIKDGASLAATEGAPFADDPRDSFRVVNYRFADTPARGQVQSGDAPLLISTLFE